MKWPLTTNALCPKATQSSSSRWPRATGTSRATSTTKDCADAAREDEEPRRRAGRAPREAHGAVSAWMEARGAWGVVRLSRRRRGLELPPEIPINDFGNAVNELAKSVSRPYPGGSKAAWERFVERESGPRVIRSADAPKRE